jgi:HSP20 family molecular chaperone IbpA
MPHWNGDDTYGLFPSRRFFSFPLHGADFENLISLKSWQLKGDKYILELSMAGIPKEQISICHNGHALTVTGEFQTENETRKYDYNLTVPVDGDLGKIDAQTRDGILTITVPRVSRPETSKIVVR